MARASKDLKTLDCIDLVSIGIGESPADDSMLAIVIEINDPDKDNNTVEIALPLSKARMLELAYQICKLIQGEQ